MLQFADLERKRVKIAVVGLGYVGLPLAVALADCFQVIGFDVSGDRVRELVSGQDRTREVDRERLTGVEIQYTSDPEILSEAGLIIVAVPTPIDGYRRPDLEPIRRAAAHVGKNLTRDSVVVFESTVFPGLTEEICIPVLEQESGLCCGPDFQVGYSPERINPGDKVHTLANIVKVVAGQDPATTDLLAAVYGKVVSAGIFKASSIKVAEAAKVIENTQRDLNIALMNELSLIFQKMEIDTQEVLEAAGTKWNFLPFRPGLVGGHCIGVDPYYLTFQAERLGYHPQVILAGRRINDSMGEYVARTVVKKMIQAGFSIKGSRLGVLGLAFKENVPDLRNTRVIDIVRELESFDIEVLICDPLADKGEAEKELGVNLVGIQEFTDLEGIILSVPHDAFLRYSALEIKGCLQEKGLFFDLKGRFPVQGLEKAGLAYWRL